MIQMPTDWIYLIQGLTLGFSATATPGPFQAYLLHQTSTHGLKRALPLCLAPLLSDGPIIILVLFILSHIHPAFIQILQILGGIYLICLAVLAWFSQPKNAASTTAQKTPTFFHAVLMNLMNPAPYVFWSTVSGPIFIKACSQSIALGIAFLASFYLVLIGGFMAFVVLAHLAIRISPHTQNLLRILSVVILLGFGLYQIAAGLMLF
jgi:threonine/homoserine/homoserine lactone efflux protein